MYAVPCVPSPCLLSCTRSWATSPLDACSHALIAPSRIARWFSPAVHFQTANSGATSKHEQLNSHERNMQGKQRER